MLRPGGHLVFLGNHPLTILTTPASGAPSERVLHRPYRNLTGADWTGVEFDPGGVEFNRTISGWIALFRDIGFQVTDYRELFAREADKGTVFSVPSDWAQDYPSEQVWWLKRL